MSKERLQPNNGDPLLYFDNGFLRKLLESPKCVEQSRWQKFYFDLFNKKFIPCNILTTASKFLEYLGIQPKNRFQCRWEYSNDVRSADVDSKQIQSLIDQQIISLVNKGMEHYSAMEELSLDNYRNRIDVMYENHIGVTDFQRFIAQDVLLRFVQKDGIDEYIRRCLVFDDIQNSLRTLANENFLRIAQLRIFLCLTEAQMRGFNMSSIRLIRQMYSSIEEKFSLDTRKTAFKLKSKGDLSDVDYLYHSILGGWHSSEQRRVHIFTCDDYDDTYIKIQISKDFLDLLYYKILRKQILRFGLGLPNLVQGYVYCAEGYVRYYRRIKVENLKPYEGRFFMDLEGAI